MADNNNVIGLTIGLDTSSLKAGLADAGRRIKEAGAEFKAATAGMDDWRKSSEGLNAKLKQLNSNLSVQQATLDLMEKEYEKAGYAQDDMSKAAVDLRTKIANQKATIAQTQKTLDKFAKELEDLSSAEEEVDKASGDTNNVLKEQKGATKEAGDGFTVLKGTMANLLSQGISKLIGGFKNLATSALNMAEATREYREDLGKLEAAFASSDKSSKSATDTYKKLYGAIGETDTAVEAAQQIALLADSEEQVTKWADLATGVVGKFGDALKPETFYEAANETLKLGTATGGFTQMLEQSGINVDKFNEHLASLNTEEEKQAYMLEVSSGALGKAGEEYEKINGDIIKAREETAKYTEKQAELGKKMEPVSSAITTFKTELLDTVLANVDFEKAAETVSEVLTKFKDEVLPKVIEGFKWIKDNLPAIKNTVVVLGSAFAAWKVATIITNIVKAFKVWRAATVGMTAAQWLLNVAMSANPIGLIVAAIAALVAGLVLAYKKSEKFREIVNSIGEAFKKVGKFIADVFTGKFEWPKIKMPKFEITPEGWKIGDLLKGKIPKLKINWNAKGGIFDKPTVLRGVGEDGAEAVIPLERNLGWIKHLSANIVKEMQVPQASGIASSTNNTTNFTQIINAPAQPPLDEMYRNTKNLLNLKAVTN